MNECPTEDRLARRALSLLATEIVRQQFGKDPLHPLLVKHVAASDWEKFDEESKSLDSLEM